MNTKIQCKQLSCLVLCLGSIVNASTVNYLPDVNGTTDVASGISASTTGATMAGEMTVSINGGAPVLWTTGVGTCTAGIGCGQASGAIAGGTWMLQEVGDPGAVANINQPETTALKSWVLTNTSTTTPITSVVINGDLSTANGDPSNSCFVANAGVCVAGVVFDRDRATATGADSGGQEGTPNGSFGVTYTEQTSSEVGGPYGVGVTYSNIVALQGSKPGSALARLFLATAPLPAAVMNGLH